MFQNILFDLDGTLTDPKEGICGSVRYALAHYGIEEPDLEKLTPFIGPPLIDSFMEFYQFSREQAVEAVEVYRERFGTIGKFENKVYDGIPELLKALHEAGATLAVASSKPEIFVKQILEHFQLDGYFQVVVGSMLDGRRTAKEEVVAEALRQLTEKNNGVALDHKTTAMVGDRKFDIQGAREHKLHAVGVGFGYAEAGELEKEGADYIAATVEDLKKYLMQS